MPITTAFELLGLKPKYQGGAYLDDYKDRWEKSLYINPDGAKYTDRINIIPEAGWLEVPFPTRIEPITFAKSLEVSQTEDGQTIVAEFIPSNSYLFDITFDIIGEDEDDFNIQFQFLKATFQLNQVLEIKNYILDKWDIYKFFVTAMPALDYTNLTVPGRISCMAYLEEIKLAEFSTPEADFASTIDTVVEGAVAAGLLAAMT